MRRLMVLVFLFLLLNSLLVLGSFIRHPAILGDTIVTASISASCNGTYITITPENRIPPTGNNALEIVVDIRPEDSSTSLFMTTVGTNNDGQVNFCIPPGVITAGYYDVYIKGISHLRRIFPHQYFLNDESHLDLKSPVLFAGDSHPTSDNYVNSMDISYEILNIYQTTLRADLNRDGIVNSLEFPTLLSHLYLTGDN